MPRTSGPPSHHKDEDAKDEQVAIIVRAPRPLVEAFDRAVQLGYFNAKSRNEAIVKVMRSALSDIFFVVEAFKKAQELVKKEQPKESTLPPEFIMMNIAFKMLAETPQAQDVEEKYAKIVALTAARLKGDRQLLEEFSSLLKKAVQEGEQK